MLSAFTYVTLEGATAAIDHSLVNFTRETKQEDFLLVLSPPAARVGSPLIDYYENLIQRIAEEFNATIAGRFYRDVIHIADESTYTFRFIRQTESVNLTSVLAGQLPTAADEIAVFKQFASQNNLTIGDALTIGDQEYIITAFIAIPDYIYPSFSFDSPLFNPRTQTIAIVTEQVYDQFTEREWVLYSGFFNDEVDSEALIMEIANFPGVAFAIGNQMNIRIGTLDFHMSSNRLLATTITSLLLLMCVIVIILIMKKRIHAEKTQIGVLKTMGYRHLIILSYLVYPLLATTIGNLIGFFLGIGFAPLLANVYVRHFILPPIYFYFTPELFLKGVVYPIGYIGVVSFIILFILMKKEPILLMQEHSSLKHLKASKWLANILRPFPFETRFKYSLAFRNFGKIASLFMVVLVISVFLVFAFIGARAVEAVVYLAFSRINYQYEVGFNRLVNHELAAAETAFLKFRVNPELEVVGLPFDLFGIDPVNEIKPLYNEQGENITKLVEKGLIINEFIARAYSLAVGDELTLEIRSKPFTYEIVGIVDHFNGPVMYTSLNRLRQDLRLRGDQFNGKWTSERPAVDERIAYVFSMHDLAENIEIGMGMIHTSLSIMVIVAILLGSFMMIIITNFIIDENQKQISILKIIGYSDREISQMILTIYVPFVVLAYLIGVVITRQGVDLMMRVIASRLPMAIPTDFTWLQMLSGGALLMLTYLIAIKISKVGLNKISFREIL